MHVRSKGKQSLISNFQLFDKFYIRMVIIFLLRNFLLLKNLIDQNWLFYGSFFFNYRIILHFWISFNITKFNYWFAFINSKFIYGFAFWITNYNKIQIYHTPYAIFTTLTPPYPSNVILNSWNLNKLVRCETVNNVIYSSFALLYN